MVLMVGDLGVSKTQILQVSLCYFCGGPITDF